MKYDVIIIGAGPGGIFSAYEMVQRSKDVKIAVFEAGHALDKRHCPIDGVKVKNCVNCKSCSIMSGFGGAGAFSDGKYNITNAFGGTLYEYIGRSQAIDLMKYVDDINMKFGGEGTKLYSTSGTAFKKICLQNKLNLLDASVRHLGTDINLIVLGNLYAELKDKVDFYFDTPVQTVKALDEGYEVVCENGSYYSDKCIISVGRSGSKWMEQICRDLQINTKSNRVDIGVRVELPAVIFSHLTDELYESKIVYRTEKFEDAVRTFCMNPHGIVVNENTNGIIRNNMGDGKMAFVSRDDCALAAACAAMSDWEDRIVDINGAELLTIAQYMAIASEVTGKKTEYQYINDDEMYEFFDSIGVPRTTEEMWADTAKNFPFCSDGMVSFGRAIRLNQMSTFTDDFEKLTGQKPITVREMFEDMENHLIGTRTSTDN